MKHLALLLLLGLSTACASTSAVDRSMVNHPAMDLTKAPSPFGTNYLTTLEASDKQVGGGTCATCAH